MFKRIIGVAVLAVVLAPAGCKKGDDHAHGHGDHPHGDHAHGEHTQAELAPKTAPAAADERLDADAAKAATAALASYEQLRDLLARDTTDGLDGSADKLAEQAAAGAKSASGKAKAAFEGLAAASTALKDKKNDWDALRKQYGEVSKHAVELLVAVPTLRQGRHLFECPMAQGYRKWIQVADKMENPYMGQKMLECGSKVDWEV